MGQWYSICANIKPKKGKAQEAVAKYNAIVKEMVDSGEANFGDNRKPVRSVVGIQKELFAEKQGDFRFESGTCYSCFHGSYGWETIMVKAFDKIASLFEEGSCVVIDMDEGFRSLVVYKGRTLDDFDRNEPNEGDNNE